MRTKCGHEDREMTAAGVAPGVAQTVICGTCWGIAQHKYMADLPKPDSNPYRPETAGADNHWRDVLKTREALVSTYTHTYRPRALAKYGEEGTRERWQGLVRGMQYALAQPLEWWPRARYPEAGQIIKQAQADMAVQEVV